MKSKEVAEKLKAYREAQGLSQKEVGIVLNYGSPQFISNWERGVATPPIKSLKKLCRLYQVNADYLLEDIIKAKQELDEKKMRREYVRSK